MASLPRRVYLTYRYRGFASVLYQTLVFPLRLTPLDRLLSLGPAGSEVAAARRWYRLYGEPVTIVIPSFRDARLVARLVSKIRQTTPRAAVQILVSDDASGPEHVASLRELDVELVESEVNGGFSVNVNRGLRAADPRHDVVLLNSDVVPIRGWLEALQYAATRRTEIGIVGAKLLYPDNRIQYGGTVRNLRDPLWFDHRYRFKPADWGPSDVPGPTLAATGAAMYIRREVLDRLGLFDEELPMAYEDVDYCLRAWRAGYEVRYAPSARLHHHESATRGTDFGEREQRSQRVFWRRWGSALDERSVRGPDGRLRVVYVTEDTFVGGGHRLVFEHLNGLADRGHEVALWTLGGSPEWFALRCPVRSFSGFEELVKALAPLEAIKVATWWKTATPVWQASVIRGLPVYFVQDIETSYYPDDPGQRYAVLESYRPEFRYMTTSSWNRRHLEELDLPTAMIEPGIDLERFRALGDVPRNDDLLLALGRSDPLKNLSLTLRAWRRLPEPRPELCLFGSEPELASEPGLRYVTAPSDEEVNRLLNEACVFLQTSAHEGFSLPILESMATGGAVICTDAHGNRDFCIDGQNCLIPEAHPRAVAGAISRLLSEPDLRARLGQAAARTAAGHAWPKQIDKLERFLLELAEPRRGGRLRRARGPQRPGGRCG